MHRPTEGKEMIYEKILMYCTRLSTFQLILLRKRIEDLLQKRMEKPKSIDKMVTETPDELDEIYRQFNGGIENSCPICKSLLNGGDCQKPHRENREE